MKQLGEEEAVCFDVGIVFVVGVNDVDFHLEDR